jgi:hypothetical protein
MRAFYSFLKREFGLKQADSCLQVLGSNAVRKLEAALSDSSNFGMAKSLFMAGADAGFDMQSKEGIESWMQSIRASPCRRRSRCQVCLNHRRRRPPRPRRTNAKPPARRGRRTGRP